MRRWMSCLCALLLMPLAVAAGTVERRVDTLASARVAGTATTLALAGGTSLQFDLARIDVIDLRRPARPPRRSLRLATPGMGVVLDLRRDAEGNIRFGRVFLAADRDAADRFFAREFGGRRGTP